MLAKEWDVIEADLDILSDTLKATEEVEQENYSVWRQQSILRLPASCFVWCDEFEEAFRRSYSPERLILWNKRPGDRELNFSPRIPEELTLAVMQGFSVIQPNNNSSSSVEKPLYPREGEAHLKLDQLDEASAAFKDASALGAEPWASRGLGVNLKVK